MPSAPRLMASVLGLLALLGGCAPGQDGTVVVLAASSLEPVVEDLIEASGIDAVVSAAGSQVLRAQVEARAPADLVLLADPDIAQELAAAGLAPAPATIATSRLAILARPGTDIRGPEDLARPGLRVVIADRDVPLGRYTRAAFEQWSASGLLTSDQLAAVDDNIVSLEDSAALVRAKVTSGAADAAISYLVDVGELDHVPLDNVAGARYTLQRLTDLAGAHELEAFLRSEAARAIWEAHGFTPS